MNIDIDDTTKAHILAMAAHQHKAPEQIAAQWLRQISRQHFIADETREDDMRRFAETKADGGIPHDEMMNWLDELAAGKDV